jgi:hypothetical protein
MAGALRRSAMQSSLPANLAALALISPGLGSSAEHRIEMEIIRNSKTAKYLISTLI